jgi:hypothetical protein
MIRALRAVSSGLAAALAFALPALAAPTTIIARFDASGSGSYPIPTSGGCGAGQVAVVAVGGDGGSGLPFGLTDQRGNTWVAGTFAKDSTAQLLVFRSKLTTAIQPGDTLTVTTPGTTSMSPFTVGLCFPDGTAVGATEGPDPAVGAGTNHSLTMTASAAFPSYKVMGVFFRASWVGRSSLSNVTEAASVTNGGTSGLVVGFASEPAAAGATTSDWTTTGAALNAAAWGEVDAAAAGGAGSPHRQTTLGVR